MQFQNPILLLLMLLIPAIVFLRLKRHRAAALKFSGLEELRRAMPPERGMMRHLPLALRCAAVFFFALAMARPVRGVAHSKVFSEGIDIVLAIDVSSSMDARDMTDDLRVNRLAAAKEVVTRFIPERRNDRIGVVAFARYAYTQAPLTLDHDVLIDIVDRLQIVPQGGEEDGTAIGSAIITGSGRLKESGGKSKVIILLTDGMNNFGEVGPEAAAEAAKALTIKIYTIGVGRKGLAPYPVKVFGQWTMTKIKTDIDEESLRKVAAITGGQYYRAQDERALAEIYGRINAMEKVRIEEEKFMEYRDLFPYFLIPGLCLVLIETVIASTLLRRLP
jgi:Ca-activated chloride channel family protein